MGTNYYVTDNFCEHCNKFDEVGHLGKSSAGWCFSLHVDPDNGIRTLGDWIEKITRENLVIVSEYQDKINLEEFLKLVKDRHWDRADKVPFGYKSWDEFYSLNHSEPGPNGLLRHKIDDSHCIGHGYGTFDYIVGEFS